MRKSVQVAAAAAFLGAVLTDAAFHRRVAHASQLPEPAAWVPSRATMVVYLDWNAFLSSPPLRGLEQVVTQEESWTELQEFGELTGMDLWRDVWSFCLFMSPSENGTSSWGFAAYGAFDPERVLETMETRRTVARSEYRETTLYEVGAFDPRLGGEQQALAFPDSTTVIYGPVSQLRAMIDSRYGFAPSATDGDLSRWIRRLSMSETIWLLSTGDAELLTQNVVGDPSSHVPPLESFAISARFGSKVGVDIWGEAEDSEQAGKLADVIRGMRALASFQQPPDAILQSVLESLEIDTLDETVEVSFEVEGKAVRDFLKNKTNGGEKEERSDKASLPKP